MKRLPDDLRQLLTDSGLPWRIETGGQHLKIIVGGRFVGILPKSLHVRNKTYRAHKNTVAQVRRAIRKHRC